LLIAGTVNEVVDKLLAFREHIGAFGTLLYVGHDWADRAAMRRSMELMAEEVLPRVNRALGE
jgi:alkanesulfonate monooxygenase SsuD/methylene tetrahydromethanopterin reductase-like flavin-dependent oxidoreductase (luciferase family)